MAELKRNCLNWFNESSVRKKTDVSVFTKLEQNSPPFQGYNFQI